MTNLWWHWIEIGTGRHCYAPAYAAQRPHFVPDYAERIVYAESVVNASAE